MVRTQVQLSEDEARALKRLAAERDTSVAALIREGVDLLLRSKRRPGVEELRRRALGAVGRFHSGRRDVSQRHDDYLAEAFSE
jgi:Antitoxin-like ribbon-helix-helix